MTDYILITKLGTAEIRAMQNMTDEVKHHVTPLIEITRGRKIPSSRKPEPEEWSPFDKFLGQVKEIWRGHDVIVDLTSWEYLSNVTIDKMFDYANGYEKWRTFIEQLDDEACFNSITPCIITNGEDPDFNTNLREQVSALCERFDAIAYRSSIADEMCYKDIETIKDCLNSKQLLFIIDAGYVSSISMGSFYNKISKRIENIKPIIPTNTKIVVSATSFPNNISEIGGRDYDEFVLSEVKLHEQFLGQGIMYSDYGCVNPQRNDGIVMARGWIPRIDVPLSDRVFYCRKRRPKGTHKYSDTYNEVAKMTVAKPNFPIDLNHNWGIQQIRACAGGASPSAQPNFWISVRMSIHVETQVRRICDLECCEAG